MDSADQEKLATCKEELHGLIKEERLAGASLLILANKQDLAGSLNSEKIKKVLGLEDIKTHNWALYGISAIASDDVLEPFEWLVNDVGTRLYKATT